MKLNSRIGTEQLYIKSPRCELANVPQVEKLYYILEIQYQLEIKNYQATKKHV